MLLISLLFEGGTFPEFHSYKFNGSGTSGYYMDGDDEKYEDSPEGYDNDGEDGDGGTFNINSSIYDLEPFVLDDSGIEIEYLKTLTK